MKITIAHEWLTNLAGSEQVALGMLEATGSSEMIVGIQDEAFSRTLPALHHTRVKELWPSKLPRAQTRWISYAPALMTAWASTRIESDALIVSSHFAAHAASLRFDGPSLVYYHTPARIIWRPDLELDRLSPLMQTAFSRLALPGLRRWDKHVAQAPTKILANSNAVARRIFESYGRRAEVLHPPVDTEKFSTVVKGTPRYFIWLGRLVAYKRPDVVVEAARQSGVELKIVGDGPEKKKLESNAPANVEFLGRRSVDEVRGLLGHAIALVFPGEEDFGLVPVEVMAAGIPVIALGKGGSLDYMEEGLNGTLVPSQDPELWAHEFLEFSADSFTSEQVSCTAARFERDKFRQGLRYHLNECVGR